MISIVITSFKEPKTIGKAIESFTNQKISSKYELIICAPDKETLSVARSYQKKNKNLKLFKDPGKGKSFALNSLLKKLKGEIIILSDGDVFVSQFSVKELLKQFLEPKVGCVTGRPVSLNSKRTLFGYWSHLLCDSADLLRIQRAKKDRFLECSGYLWAFRNNVIKRFPLDIAEDTVVPLLFREKNYFIRYSRKAEVYAKFPENLSDFINQKKRTAKGHESLSKYVNVKKLPRMKTFTNEIKGSLFVLTYASTLKEFFWTLLLFPLRLYIWILVFYHTQVTHQHYSDAWERVESTKN